MKKVIVIMFLITVILGIILGVSYLRADASQSTISDKLIRFHVIANSDTVEDQALKLKVRDEVLDYMAPLLKESKSIDESRELIKKNDNVIKEIAKKVIKDKGYTYTVETMLSNENFPVKSYGNITLPQGNYEAYRIIIGNGSGRNWWCVMFPPLCFTDITRGEASYKETEENMKKILTEDEYRLVNANEASANKIEYRFKIVDTIKGLYKRIQDR